MAGGSMEALLPGAQSEDGQSILTKHWPVAIQGTIATGLIAALAAGDDVNFNNAEVVGDQLHRSTASGVYLDRRMADFGLQRPINVGLGDSVYRKLGLKVTNRKVVIEAFLDVLDAYYGQDSSRAHATSSAGQPYALQDGWTLTLLIDGVLPVTVPVKASDYAAVGAATAAEVAAVITRWMSLNGSQAYALAFFDPNTGLTRVRIYSGSLGLAGKVVVTGGQAQNAFQFPTLLTQATPGDVWVVSLPVPGTTRYTLSSNTTAVNLLLVQVGDYANVFGSNFSAGNRGSLPITNVDVRYTAGTLVQFFEVSSGTGVVQGGVVTAFSSDLMFFRPQIQSVTTRTGSDVVTNAAVLSITKPGEVDVQLPTTTIAVSRGPMTGAYAVAQSTVPVSTLVRLLPGSVTVNAGSAHGLTTGQWFFLDGVVPNWNPPAPVIGNLVGPGFPLLLFPQPGGALTTNASPISIWSTMGQLPGSSPTERPNVVALQNGKVFVNGGYTTSPAAPMTDTRLIAITGSSVLSNGGTQYTFTLTAAAAMPVGLSFHKSSVLTDPNQNGNVLITGGYNGAAVVSSAYIYNVGGNSWSANIPMSNTRFQHTQTTLNDGRVMVTGGAPTSGGTSLTSVEMFTPSVGGGSWGGSPVPLLVGRYRHTATKMSDGKILIVGGAPVDNGPTGIAFCEIYDPVGNVSVLTGSMTFARFDHQAIWLPGDQVLVIGGFAHQACYPATSGEQNTATAEIYDYKSGRWYPAGQQSSARAEVHAQYLTASNRVVVFGATTVVDYFDVATRTWVSEPSAAPRAAGLTGDAILNSTLVVNVGGASSGGAGSEVDVFIPASDTISGGQVNGLRAVTAAPTGTSLQFQTPELLGYTSDVGGVATILPMNEKPAAVGQPGPYAWDTVDGPAIGNISTTTTTAIRAGQHYASLGVTSTVGFPDATGYICLGFGTSAQTFPVHYTGLVDSQTLALDFTSNFSVDIPIGSSVTLLVQKGPWTPPIPTTLGSFYLTDTASARIAAESNLSSVAAAGISLVETIVYPGDRGLGGESLPTIGVTKLSDRVEIWAGDDVDAEVAAAKAE